MQPLRQILADFVFPEGAERRNRLERLANTDPMTGVGNRRALTAALLSAERDPTLSIIMGDGNSFGKLNKVAGHLVGDSAILYMAKAFRCHSDRVFRFGGDEFVAIVPAVRGEVTRLAIEGTFGIAHHGDLEISVCCGVGQTLADAEVDMLRRKPKK